MEDEIDCLSITGQMKRVPRSQLQFRPGSYALIHRDGKILLIGARLNGKWCLPGGGMEPGESALDALHREVKEETGLEISVGKFFGVYESFYYFDSENKAFHGILLCWACSAVENGGTSLDPIAGDPEEGQPVWVDVARLYEEDCFGPTWAIVCHYLGRTPHRGE